MYVEVTVKIRVKATTEDEAIRLLNPIVDNLNPGPVPSPEFITFAEIHDAEIVID